jgi:hypothetical protein
MKRAFTISILAISAIFAAAGCGEVRDPLTKEKPYVATPVPADFAIQMDESADTYYARQDIQQRITTADLMSRTTYTTHRDYNDTIARQFTQDHPLNQGQLQAMWNEVVKYNLMSGGKAWYYWMTNADNYRRSERVMQIRADGKVVEFKLLNHWGYKLRDLALLVEAVRLPVADGSGTQVVTEPPPATATAPATESATTASAVEPTTAPTTIPSTSGTTQP